MASKNNFYNFRSMSEKDLEMLPIHSVNILLKFRSLLKTKDNIMYTNGRVSLRTLLAGPQPPQSGHRISFLGHTK